jgi:ribose/xylose/arabinose/galactoside ABC-type transport system permease subunit
MKIDKAKIGQLLGEFRLLFVLLVLMVGLSFVSPRFLTMGNLTNVLWSVCLIGIMASGTIYGPVTAGNDLSVGSHAALAGIIAYVLMNYAHIPWIPAILITLCCGLLIGWINGVMIAKFKVPPFIQTMAAKTYLFGIAMLVSNGDTITIMGPEPFLKIGIGKLFSLPIPIYIMATVAITSHFVLKHTVFGRQAISVGANEVAARLSGVDPERTRIAAYMISGFTASLAGIVMASLTQQAYAPNASGYEFDVLTAIIIGGARLKGGQGSVGGAIIGAVMVGLINNALNLANLPASFSPLVTGIVILIALILNQSVSLPGSPKAREA